MGDMASTLTLPDGRRSAALQPGSVIGGNLRVVSRIGAGGMGAVYLATDTGPLGRSCAVKVLDSVSAGAAGHARFLAEARIMAALRHPNIVPVSRFGTDAATGLDFYVMDEFLPSREEAARICHDVLHCPCPAFADERAPLTLSRLIDGGKALPEAAVVSIALQLLSAMEAAHSLSPPVVHRDIKPSNILFAGDGRALLSDFGIAKRLAGDNGGEAATAELTAHNATPGTWAYAAPEQKNGGAIGKATDYYAFGLVLFRALTGGMPSATAALPTDIAPNVSKEWPRLFAGLLKFDPATRLADAESVRQLLGRIGAEAGRRREGRRMWLLVAAGVAIAAAILTGLRVMRPMPARFEEPRRQDGEDATVEPLEAPSLRPDVATLPDAPQPEPPFDYKAWCRQHADSLRETLDQTISPPMPDADGRIVVREGRILLSGDMLDSASAREVVLDGGELVFSPPAEELRRILAKCEDFIANAPDGAATPDGILPTWRERMDIPIAVTGRGGGLNVVDGEITALVAGPVRRAAGTEAATLNVFGFSAIVLNRSTLDPDLQIKGAGQIADIGEDGRVRNRRWFDRDNPL